MNKRVLRISLVLLTIQLSAAFAIAQTKVTTPKEQLGFNFGDDYQLANYTQLVDYWKKLAQQSDRMKLVEIGKTAEGRTMVRSEEHTSELQSLRHLVCRLLLEKKKKNK